MKQVYSFKSTSDQSATINDDEPITLNEGSTHRLILKPEVVRESRDSEPKLKLSFYRQRKSLKACWENEPDPSVHLKAGEMKSLKLDTREMGLVLEHIDKLITLVSSYGFTFGERNYVVAPEEQVIWVQDWKKANALKTLIADNPKDIWGEIVRSNTDLATWLAESRVNEARKRALEEFEKNINDQSYDEGYWQSFFKKNTWIFGYGLNYQFLDLECEQPNYGGASISGDGAQRGDYLMSTRSRETKFTVLVEIKKPHTCLFGTSKYRNGAWELNKELIGAVSQVQANCSQWERASNYPENRSLEEKSAFTVEPKGILVVGNTSQFIGSNTEEQRWKRETFQRFRGSLSNPEIITFDELLERARFIVHHTGAELEQDE